ncbi:MAG: hypothetical protein JNK29_19605, partial [Anaerolineales bacterium]|nr:hypothetical protein [Anaerolineales bacterium]
MRSSLIRWGLCLTLLLAGLPAVPPDRAQAAGTWYVAPQGNDGQDCLSALTPCQTIQGAIGRAAAGDLIKVAVGSYTSSNTEVVLVDRDLTISGGWEAGFASAVGMSTLDGQQARRGVTVLPGVTAYIERFLIQYGRPTSSGGGVSNQGALTLSAVTIYSSTVAAIGPLGGGVYNTGAITITASTIDDNRAAYGGGLYSSGATVLDHVQVRRNVVTSLIFGAGSLSGGGLDFTDSATTLVRESVLLDNRAEVLNDFGGFTSGMG